MNLPVCEVQSLPEVRRGLPVCGLSPLGVRGCSAKDSHITFVALMSSIVGPAIHSAIKTLPSQSFHLKCDYCNESSTVVAPMAKAHWVTEWT